jgi:hypothetical protein
MSRDLPLTPSGGRESEAALGGCRCVICGDCMGSGHVEVSTSGYPETDLESCSMCDGSGIVDQCARCADLEEMLEELP